MTEPPRNGVPLALAAVATIVPDEPRFHGPAFNRAAQMFQDELIRGLSMAGMTPSSIFSIEPLPSFPRTRRLFGRSGWETLRSGQRARLLPYFNVHPWKTLTTGLATFLVLVRWAWRHRDATRVMHVVNLTMPPGVFVWLAGRLTGSYVTVSVLDVWKPGGLVPDNFAWRLDFAMQRWLLPRFDGHMVVSQAIADDLIPNRRVCLLEGGIAPDRFASSHEREPRSKSGPFRMVLSGSLEPYNGLELAAEAMSLLPGAYELIVAGTGSLFERAKEYSSRDPRIRVLGFLSFEEVLSLYSSADLLLNPRLTQRFDTRYFFPSKLMELLASGTPVLTTCTGHVESEFGHVLYLLREETPQALARRVQEIRQGDRSQHLALGTSAREFMLREKTWERQGQRLAEYIRQEVVGARRTHAPRLRV